RSTGQLFGMRMDHWVDERRDFVTATHAACRYLKRLHRQFGHWHLAWASYNAGEGRIGRALRRTGVGTYWELVDRNAIPKETRHYVPKIIAAAIIAKNAESYGFTNIQGHVPLRYDSFQVKDAIDLKRMSRAIGVSLNALRELNPSLLHDLTPPRRPSTLRVPEGHGEQAQAWIETQPPLKLVDLKHYRVRAGDTLSGVARRFGVSIASLKDFNALRSVHALRVGQRLMVPVNVGGAKVKSKGKTRKRRTAVAASRERRHVVSAGETLWSISQRYRCSVDDIRRWNRLRGSSIQSGQVLTIRR
ncbi:MAG: LysM peptidoglycan-binding domain-containing protein, partial [Myxococcota bacterium]